MSIPHGDSEFFLCPTLVTRQKKTSFLKHKDFRKYRKCFTGSQKQPNIFLLQTEIAKDVWWLHEFVR